MNIKTFYKKLFQYQLTHYLLIPVISSFLLLIVSLFIKEASFSGVLTFLRESSKISVLTFLIILALLYIFYALFNHLYFSIVIISTITLLISVLNEVKQAFLDITLCISIKTSHPNSS